MPRSETTEFFLEVRLTREHRHPFLNFKKATSLSTTALCHKFGLYGVDAKALVYARGVRRIG